LAARIEDYAMIGNCRSAALVCRNGSIDWLCVPRFDNGACFAAILGTSEHGRWWLAPVDPAARCTRRYRDGGLVLETTWETVDGAVRVIDFMPVDGDQVGVMRVVEGIRGALDMHEELVIRFDYGRSIPWVTGLDDGSLRAIAGPDLLVRRSPVAVQGRDMRSVATFTVHAGDVIPFSLEYGRSHLPIPAERDVQEALKTTEAFWAGWTRDCSETGQWAPLVQRSLITLKGLSYMPTGAIIAAPTTSLPEAIGGERNWDYRFCWARDATFVLTALMNAGHHEEAVAWRDWIQRAIAGAPDQIQIMYGVAGERRMHEHELPWLPGYENSAPVRIGNAASEQFQMDIYGEMVGVFDHAVRSGVFPAPTDFDHEYAADTIQVLFIDHLAKVLNDPDEGIWEIRGRPRCFVHSRAMAWLALRRSADSENEQLPPEKRAAWSKLADDLRAEILELGVHPEGQYFVQSYGSTELDASLLLVTLCGIVPADDPRVANTVAAIERELLVEGLVKRYHTGTGVDGLAPGEGLFLACSFWLVENYVMLGRMDDANRLFARLAGLANDVGLLAEEYDPVAKRQLGNFPQAFSHVALVNAAYSIARSASVTAKSREGLEAAVTS
jgi:GH15 family glucan-1,4-alpha-glucosidase